MAMPTVVKEQIYRLEALSIQLVKPIDLNNLESWDRRFTPRSDRNSYEFYEGSGDIFSGESYEDDEDFDRFESSGDFSTTFGSGDGLNEEEEDSTFTSSPSTTTTTTTTTTSRTSAATTERSIDPISSTTTPKTPSSRSAIAVSSLFANSLGLLFYFLYVCKASSL